MPSRQSFRSAGVEPRFFARHLVKNPPPASCPPAIASTGGPLCAVWIRVGSGVVILPWAQLDPADLATCTEAVDARPVLARAPQCSRSSSVAPPPSGGTRSDTVPLALASLPLAVSFPCTVCLFRVSHFWGSVQETSRNEPTHRMFQFLVCQATRE